MMHYDSPPAHGTCILSLCNLPLPHCYWPWAALNLNLNALTQASIYLSVALWWCQLHLLSADYLSLLLSGSGSDHDTFLAAM